MSIIENNLNIKISVEYENINDEWYVYSKKIFGDNNIMHYCQNGFCKIKELEKLKNEIFFKPVYYENEESAKFSLDLSKSEPEPLHLCLVKKSFVEQFRKDARAYYTKFQESKLQTTFQLLSYFKAHQEEGFILVDDKEELVLKDVINNKYLARSVLFDIFCPTQIRSSMYDLDKVIKILKSRTDFEYLGKCSTRISYIANEDEEFLNFVWHPTDTDWNKYMTDIFEKGLLEKPQTWCLKHILDLSAARIREEEIKTSLFCRMNSQCKLGHHIFEADNEICVKCKQEKKL